MRQADSANIIAHPRAATLQAALAIASPEERKAFRERARRVIDLLVSERGRMRLQGGEVQ